MKIELISFALCPFVHRATTMLHEKGIEFDIRYIDLKQKPDWFLAISPRGKVPVLVADGVPIFESAVIMEFLDETHAPRMLPDDPIQRARQRSWIEVTNDLFAQLYKLATASAKEDFDHARLAIDGIFARFGDALHEPYFAGDEFGFVDVAVAPAFHRLRNVDDIFHIRLIQALPKIEAWGQRLAERPSVVRGVLPDFRARYEEALRNSGGYLSRSVLSDPASFELGPVGA